MYILIFELEVTVLKNVNKPSLNEESCRVPHKNYFYSLNTYILNKMTKKRSLCRLKVN